MKQNSLPKPNRTLVNYLIDIAIFLAFLIAMNPHATGMSIHEWLGIAFGGAIITHLLLHWQWIVGITRQFFGKVNHSARLNYLVNLLFFVDMTVIIFSGIMISEAALPTLGITLGNSFALKGIHTTAADLALPILGLHVALHWHWIVDRTKGYFHKLRPSKPDVPAKPFPKELLQKGI